MSVSAHQVKRIVVKVGTSTLTYPNGTQNIRRSAKLVEVLADLANRNLEVILVSSGAIAIGMGKLGLLERPQDTPMLQACAAVGQCELMYYYDKNFSEHNRTIAQVLLTSQDLVNPVESQHVVNTLDCLLKARILPVINENDTVSIFEIHHGDNDSLSARVARLMRADTLVMLSDIDGFYETDPRVDENAKLMELVDIGDSQVEKMVSGSGSNLGTGGMKTKLDAARIAVPSGVRTFVLNGSDPTILYDLLDGEARGSEFVEAL